MSMAALDYFLSCIPIPSTTAVPIEGTPLYNYLLDRQLDSVGRGRDLDIGRKFVAWTRLDDARVQELTAPEFSATRASVRAGKPVVLGLIYAKEKVDLRKAFDNHQVLAHKASIQSPGVTDLQIYDPNWPGDGTVKIRCAVLGARVHSWHIIPTGPKPVRGFFRIPYTKRLPPCLP